jgi:Tol biopolymer transport system component
MRDAVRRTLLVAATAFGAAACAHEGGGGAGTGAPTAAAGPRPVPVIDAAPYRRLVETLASDAFEGRGVLTAGNEKATALLEAELRAAGLRPGAPDGTYRGCFEQPVALHAGEAWLEVGGMRLEAASGALAAAPFSESGAFDGPLVFAGYGIHDPDDGYDDYTGLDASGKVLLVMRFEPREADPKSPLNGEHPSRFSELRRKAFEAKARGARAVVFVAPPRPGETPDKRVPSPEGLEAESTAGIPVLHVLPAEADSWLRAAGTSLGDEVAAIDRDFASHARALGTARGAVKVEREVRRLCNVIGILPGHGTLAGEAVVVGAHFDHLGYGQAGTLEPGVHAVHNGADDNASGAAALVSVARALAADEGAAAAPRRAVVFAAFNAEEVGLAGSSAYVAAPAVPLAATDVMLNMDMIGRLREDKLVVLGTDSGDVWSRWLAEEAPRVGLTIVPHGDGYGPSDQTAFYAHGVPVLHFFTGAHADYHRPSDDADKLDYAGAARVIALVTMMARRAAEAPVRVAYRETSAGPTMAGDSRGYGSWLGTIPDYTAMSPDAGGGVLLGGVRKGGPAEEAGLRAGDRIVAMAGRAVGNLYDMTFVLRDHKPGEVIEVTVERSGSKVTVAATLRSRDDMGDGGSPHGGDPHGGSVASSGGTDPHGTGVAASAPAPPALDAATLLYPGEERHLRHVVQLTFAGENAEAYWAPDGKRLVFQARGEGVPCDRIYVMDVATKAATPVSSGAGRTTCSFFTYPKGDAILYASTHLAGADCPPKPDLSRGYVWPVYASYDLFLLKPWPSKKKGTTPPLVRLTATPGYDAEATACFRDGRIVFTSSRDGDLDLYTMDVRKPAVVKRLTDAPGYDGGAFFSPDCKRLVWRASRPAAGAELDEYRALLKEGLVKPSKMEIWVGAADGSGGRAVTALRAASFAPYFLPDSRRVIFASNVADPKGRNFDLYLVDPEAADPAATLERVTWSPEFEAFPMFSPDGKRLVFSSNRNGKTPGDTNLFVAEWVD